LRLSIGLAIEFYSCGSHGCDLLKRAVERSSTSARAGAASQVRFTKPITMRGALQPDPGFGGGCVFD
jgi:hypothetical protein